MLGLTELMRTQAHTVLTFAGAKRIYRLPVLTAPFCQALLQELEHFEQSDMPKGRPNTMNNYGVGEAGTAGAGGTCLRCWRRAVGACWGLGLPVCKMRSW